MDSEVAWSRRLGIVRVGEPWEHGDEAHEAERVTGDLSVRGALQAEEFLHATGGTDRDHEASGCGELVEQCSGNGVGGAGGEDGVEWRTGIRPAGKSVAAAHGDIVDAQGGEVGRSLSGENRVAFERADLAAEPGEDGGLVAAAGADLEHPVPGVRGRGPRSSGRRCRAGRSSGRGRSAVGDRRRRSGPRRRARTVRGGPPAWRRARAARGCRGTRSACEPCGRGGRLKDRGDPCRRLACGCLGGNAACSLRSVVVGTIDRACAIG
jgi:hypothetical protein